MVVLPPKNSASTTTAAAFIYPLFRFIAPQNPPNHPCLFQQPRVSYIKTHKRQSPYEHELVCYALELRNWIKECPRRPLTPSWQPEQMQPRPRIPSNTSDSRASRPRVMERSTTATDPYSSSELHPRRRYVIWPWGFPSSGEGGPSGPPRIDWIDVVWWRHCRLHVPPSPLSAAGGIFLRSCCRELLKWFYVANRGWKRPIWAASAHRTTCCPLSAPGRKWNCRL